METFKSALTGNSGGVTGGAQVFPFASIDLVVQGLSMARMMDPNPSSSGSGPTSSTIIDGSFVDQGSDPSYTRWLPLAFNPMVSSQPFRYAPGALPAPWGNMSCAYSLALHEDVVTPNLDMPGNGLFYLPDPNGTYNTPMAGGAPVISTELSTPAALSLEDTNGSRLVWISGVPNRDIHSTLVWNMDGSFDLTNAGPPGALKSFGTYTYHFEVMSSGLSRLLYIRDQFGNQQTLNWASGLTVSDNSSGRQIVFTPGAGGYFTSVDAPSIGGLPGTHTVLAFDGGGHMTQRSVYLAGSGTAVLTDTYGYAGPIGDAITSVNKGNALSAMTYYVDGNAADPFGNAIARLNTATYGNSGDTTSSDSGSSIQGTYTWHYGVIDRGYNWWGAVARTNTVTDALGNTTSMVYQMTSGVAGALSGLHYRAPAYTGAAANSNSWKTLYIPDIVAPTQSLNFDQLGHSWVANYDGSGNITSVFDPLGNQWQFGWSGSDLTSTADPTSLLWQYGYTSGRLTSVTDPGGATRATASYNGYGQPTSITVPAAVSASGGAETLGLTYDATKGDLIKITSPLGDALTIDTYDALGDPLSATIYPDTGNPATSTTPITSAINWNADQTMSGMLLPNGVTAGITYSNGVVTSSQSYAPAGAGGALLQQFNVSTDSRGRVYATSDRVGSVSQVRYDKNSNITRVLDGRGNTTSITYGNNNEPTAVTWPGGASQSRSYDAAGRVRQVVDERGTTSNYVYDNANRLTSIQFPSATSQNVTFNYDSAGRPTSVTRANGDSATFTYDAVRKRLTSVATSTGGYAYTVSYTYFGDGKVATMVSPVGNTNYAYDADGRLTSLTDPLSQTTTWTYDHAGRPTSQTSMTRQSKQIQTVWTYGVSGQSGDPSTSPVYLRQITQTVNGVTARQYTLKHSYLGQTLQRDAVGPSHTESSVFGYDTRGRLTSESRTLVHGGTTYTASGTYQYDLANNLQGGTGGWTYNSNNQPTSAFAMGGLPGATGLAYDAAGNLTSANGMGFTYDVWNQLTQVTGTSSGTANYTYDVFGRRASKSVGGVTTYFLYDGDDLLGESQGGSLNHTYTWGPTGLLDDAVTSGGTTTSRFPLGDDTGDVRDLISESGTTTEEQAFTAYQAMYWANNGGSWSLPVNRSGYRDSETGLTYAGGSTYIAPSIGRLTQTGPGGGTMGDGDPEDDDLADSSSVGALYGKAGRKGWKGLTSMPQWQPGSKDRVQISGMLHSLPWLGQALSLIDSLTGKDWVAGTKLSTGNRLVEGGLAILPSAGHLADGAVTGIEAVAAESKVARGASEACNLVPQVVKNRQAGLAAEDGLRTWLNGSRASFRVGNSMRYVDCFVGRVAHEAKVGRTSLSVFTKAQVAKDAALLRSGRVDAVVWHFYRSSTGRIGPSNALFSALRKAGIQVYIH